MKLNENNTILREIKKNFKHITKSIPKSFLDVTITKAWEEEVGSNCLICSACPAFSTNRMTLLELNTDWYNPFVSISLEGVGIVGNTVLTTLIIASVIYFKAWNWKEQ